MNYDDSLITKTAWYYYMENMTQQKISDKLGISRMRVIKLLETARQTGVIQFKISQERSQQLLIEEKLISRYHLQDSFVAPTPPLEHDINETIARAAAMYIGDRLTENMFINMGYGDTPSRVLNHLATIAEHPISVVSLTGGVSYYLPNTNSNIFNAKLYLYPAPLLVSSKEMCSAMRNEPPVQDIARMVRLATMTFVGIGAMNSNATIVSNGILNQNDLLCLSSQGAAGDILTHFFDKDGNPLSNEIEDRLLSTPLNTLKELNNVVGVAGGLGKVDAIRAALNGGYLDVLITDEETALKLIEET